MEFGEQMTQWREESGLTRKEFARKLSVSLTASKKLGNRTLNSQTDEIQRDC